MRKPATKSKRSGRRSWLVCEGWLRVVACAIGLALLAPSLEAAEPYGLARERAVSAGFARTADAPCFGAKQKSGEAPCPEPRDHSYCCLYCGERDHDELWRAGDPPHVEAHASTALSQRLVAYDVSKDIIRLPLGWTSTWSSRAPPIAS